MAYLFCVTENRNPRGSCRFLLFWVSFVFCSAVVGLGTDYVKGEASVVLIAFFLKERK